MTVQRVAVAARKGGVGKTTVACGLASVLAHEGRRVLVVDLDPQSNVGYVLGVDPTAPGVAELLLGEDPQALEVTANLHVLPGGSRLMDHAIQSLDPQELSDAVSMLDYDAIVFDCPPGVESLERLALVASDIALICTDSHPMAIQGAGRVLTELRQRQQKKRQCAQILSLVMTRLDFRRAMDKNLEKQLKETYPGVNYLKVCQDMALAWASSEQTPIMDYAPRSNGAKDMQQISKWVQSHA